MHHKDICFVKATFFGYIDGYWIGLELEIGLDWIIIFGVLPWWFLICLDDTKPVMTVLTVTSGMVGRISATQD
jgi:hypothetical protein